MPPSYATLTVPVGCFDNTLCHGQIGHVIAFQFEVGIAGQPELVAAFHFHAGEELVGVVRGRRPSYEKGSPDETPDEFIERIAQGGGG